MKIKVPQGATILPTTHGLQKPHIMLHGVEMKHCSQCQDWKPLSDYWNNAHNWDSLQCLCNNCEYELNTQAAKGRAIR